MTVERFLVTGAMGCLGAWVVKLLVEDGVSVVAFDLSTNDRRLRLIASDDVLARVEFVVGDITEREPLESLVAQRDITGIIHCAALQVPFVRADPPDGARVNVVGTVNVFEAIRRVAPRPIALTYASSAAVFGPPDRYPGGVVDDDSPLYPEANLYGVFKQANEGTAHIYASDHGIGSIGLRPFIIYGPGRDQGMTSTPTAAIVAAAAGTPYRISFGGSIYLHYARDVAATFITATRHADGESRVFNVPGSTTHMSELVAAIEAVIPAARGHITFEPIELAAPSRVDANRVQAALGPIPVTPLADAVAESISTFRVGLQRGLVTPA
jgi:nucleoside-diphosphate-sugar epimerase